MVVVFPEPAAPSMIETAPLRPATYSMARVGETADLDLALVAKLLDLVLDVLGGKREGLALREGEGEVARFLLHLERVAG